MAIPAWVWYVAAALQFIGHQLDGLDGIQARRTGMSTPTGELFDHGIDSMVCALQVMATASALGNAPPMFALQMLLCVTTGFFFSHLEKYNVGALPFRWLCVAVGLWLLLLIVMLQASCFCRGRTTQASLVLPPSSWLRVSWARRFGMRRSR
jgi:phosphatidylglycerophosphate synthase